MRANPILPPSHLTLHGSHVAEDLDGLLHHNAAQSCVQSQDVITNKRDVEYDLQTLRPVLLGSFDLRVKHTPCLTQQAQVIHLEFQYIARYFCKVIGPCAIL